MRSLATENGADSTSSERGSSKPCARGAREMQEGRCGARVEGEERGFESGVLCVARRAAATEERTLPNACSLHEQVAGGTARTACRCAP